jgi:hypothetical protein
VDVNVIDQLLIRCSAFVIYWRKTWECNGTVHNLYTDFEKAYDSVRREMLYNVLIEFGISVKLVTLIKMYLNETHRSALVKICQIHFLSRMA